MKSTILDKKKKEEKEIVIKVDINDADYLISINPVIRKKDIKELKRIFSVIKEEGGNWQDPNDLYKDKLSEDDIQWIDELLPFSENGYNTIESVTIKTISNSEDIF